MQGNQSVLYIGARSKLWRRSNQDTHLARPHFCEKFCFLRFRIGFMDKNDFLLWNSFGRQLLPQIIIDIECAGRLGRGKVTENQLCPFLR